MNRYLWTFACHVALEMALEALDFLHVLLVFFVCKFLEWWLILNESGIDVHWDDSAVVLLRQCWPWNLPSVEQASVMGLGLAAEIESHTGECQQCLLLPPQLQELGVNVKVGLP